MRDFRFLILCLALAMRLAIPAGFMPDSSHSGYHITLCTGEGMVSAWVDAAGKIHHDKQGPQKSGDQKCAFAGLAGALDVPAAIARLEPITGQEFVAPARPEHVAIGQGLAAPPPPATGPPAIA
jgi:hypothetical protein